MHLDYVTLARTQGLRRNPRHPARGVAQCDPAHADAGRRAVHLPDRRHGHHRTAVQLRRFGQHGNRRGHQPRSAADPGHRDPVRGALHGRQPDGGPDLCAAEPEAAAWLEARAQITPLAALWLSGRCG